MSRLTNFLLSHPSETRRRSQNVFHDSLGQIVLFIYLFIYLFIISAFISSLFKVELHLTYKKAKKHQQQDSLYI